LLQSRDGRSAKQAVYFRDRRGEPHGREELARLTQRLLGLRLAENCEAAALAEQGVRALGDVPELALRRRREHGPPKEHRCCRARCSGCQSWAQNRRVKRSSRLANWI